MASAKLGASALSSTWLSAFGRVNTHCTVYNPTSPALAPAAPASWASKLVLVQPACGSGSRRVSRP